MSRHNALGKEGEQLALHFIQKKGYAILHTNWRHEKAEIDIIATKGSLLIFIEVKTRSTDRYGYPEDAVHAAKQNHLSRAAEAFLEKYNMETEIRFDVISIIMNEKATLIEHIEDAFFPY